MTVFSIPYMVMFVNVYFRTIIVYLVLGFEVWLWFIISISS